MKIEAVIVCHNYSDFLAETLPENLPNFDRIVVVTHHDDKETVKICNKYGVDVVKTAAMHTHGERFNKARCINLGLGHFRDWSFEWAIHLDADIVTPHNLKNLLYRAELRQDCIYGADRVNVYGWEHWRKHKHKLIPSWSWRYFVQPPTELFPLGARLIHEEHGYVPLGFFQLWHKSNLKKYPIAQGNAEHTDVLFACQWPRERRVLLPEVVVAHLESVDGPQPMGANWGGRKTPIFGPKGESSPAPASAPPPAGSALESHHHHRRHHHHHHHHRPYCPASGEER